MFPRITQPIFQRFSKGAVVGFSATAVLYFALYVPFLVVTDFLPFGFDNNETFSSIIHAQNILHFGLGDTYGLTDEAYGVQPGAHPYVYTHQGNFPRFFALLLYLLGATSPEAHIAIATFTVGLAGACLAYVFFARQVSPLFAFVTVAFLLTDYVLVAQWQVNSWRVWHLFFLFGSLNLANAWARGRTEPRMWLSFSTVLLFAGLFYTEVAFATFVLFFYLLWTCFGIGGEMRNRLRGTLLSLTGAVAALAILAFQVILYLGWEGFLRDLQLTFLARNSAPSLLESFEKEVLDFMTSHKLVYWDNSVKASLDLRDPWTVVRHIFRYDLLPYTPVLTTITLVSLLATSLSAAVSKLPDLSRIPARVAFHFRVSPMLRRMVIDTLLTAVAVLLFLSNRFAGIGGVAVVPIEILLKPTLAVIVPVIVVLHVTGRSLETWGWQPGWRLALLLVGGLAGAVAVHIAGPYPLNQLSLWDWVGGVSATLFASFALKSLFAPHGQGNHETSAAHFYAGAAYLAAVALLLLRHPMMYEIHYVDVTGSAFYPFWARMTASSGGMLLWKLITLAAVVLGAFVLSGRASGALKERLATLHRALPPLALGLAAFAAAYLILPGYIFTAYHTRYCPMLVFVIVIPYSMALSTAVLVAWNELMARQRSGEEAHLPVVQRSATARLSRLYPALLATVLGIGMPWYWSALQAEYLRAIPPTRYAGLFEALRKEKGRSAAVSTYAAPVAVLTATWAYYDPAFFRARGISKADFRYLWLADRQTNPEYRDPALFVCWVHQNLEQVLRTPASCSSLELIAGLRNGPAAAFPGREIARDNVRDVWSVVRLRGAP